MVQTDDVLSAGQSYQTDPSRPVRDTLWSLSVEVGDLIQRIHVGNLPMRTALVVDDPHVCGADVVERFNAVLHWVVWTHSGAREKVNSEYYEVISASR